MPYGKCIEVHTCAEGLEQLSQADSSHGQLDTSSDSSEPCIKHGTNNQKPYNHSLHYCSVHFAAKATTQAHTYSRKQKKTMAKKYGK